MSTAAPVGDSTPQASAVARRSRVLALLLAVLGLVGMFLTLLGWTAHVRDLSSTWGAPPTLWLVLGGVLVLGAAITDAVLGSRADFVEPTRGRTASATLVNRVLPWLIVALTLVGMLVIQLVHG